MENDFRVFLAKELSKVDKPFQSVLRKVLFSQTPLAPVARVMQAEYPEIDFGNMVLDGKLLKDYNAFILR